MNNKNILIIGSGVSGLTTALKLLENGHQVTIWSNEVPGQFPATSLNALAIWCPVSDPAESRSEAWSFQSLSEFERLALNPATGVAMRRYFFLKLSHEEPWYAQKFPGFRHARAGEISSQYLDAHVLDMAPAIDPGTYLPWLYNRVLAAGGRFKQRQVNQLDSCPAQFEVVINCTALGARQLVGDKQLYPIRMQVLKIKHNGFQHVVSDDSGPNGLAWIVPHHNYIRVGATFEPNVESVAIDAQATVDILKRCRAMVPGFQADLSDVIEVTAGLKPARPAIRVEQDRLSDGRLLIHNYGHGGCGYIYSHGIASEIEGYLRPR